MKTGLVLLCLCLAGFLATANWPASLGRFAHFASPQPAPDFAFMTRDGRSQRLADFRGRFVLVNLWATWCGPCVHEMPSLDRAQQKLGDRLQILAISEDRSGSSVVRPFLETHRLARLSVFLDAPMSAWHALKGRVLPTSFLIDRGGRIVAKLEGGVEWDSSSMLAELERYLATDDGAAGALKTSTAR
jgi:thiol-disulfide isomerase/thioredoxin